MINGPPRDVGGLGPNPRSRQSGSRGTAPAMWGHGGSPAPEGRFSGKPTEDADQSIPARRTTSPCWLFRDGVSFPGNETVPLVRCIRAWAEPRHHSVARRRTNLHADFCAPPASEPDPIGDLPESILRCGGEENRGQAFELSLHDLASHALGHRRAEAGHLICSGPVRIKDGRLPLRRNADHDSLK